MWVFSYKEKKKKNLQRKCKGKMLETLLTPTAPARIYNLLINDLWALGTGRGSMWHQSSTPQLQASPWPQDGRLCPSHVPDCTAADLQPGQGSGWWVCEQLQQPHGAVTASTFRSEDTRTALGGSLLRPSSRWDVGPFDLVIWISGAWSQIQLCILQQIPLPRS